MLGIKDDNPPRAFGRHVLPIVESLWWWGMVMVELVCLNGRGEACLHVRVWGEARKQPSVAVGPLLHGECHTLILYFIATNTHHAYSAHWP